MLVSYSKHMSNMSSSTKKNLPGYFAISIKSAGSRYLISTNNERAFIVSQLQDLLGVRSLLEDPYSYKRMAAHVDLLAFSIRKESIELLVFSIAKSSAITLATIVHTRLQQFQSESMLRNGESIPNIHIAALHGPHDALAKSVAIHLLHPDWEYDRYSSIGFYLYDRRGDWMRIWRLSNLFENTPSLYLSLLRSSLITDRNDTEAILDARTVAS